MLSVEERIDQREIWELAREELRKLQTRFADQQTFGVEELLKEVAREAGLHPHEIELDSSEFEVLTHRVLEVIEDSHSNNHAPYLLPPKVAAALLREPQVPEGETSAVVPIDENIQLADKLARWAIDQESVRWEVEKLEGPLYLVHNLFERIKDQRASFEWNLSLIHI